MAILDVLAELRARAERSGQFYAWGAVSCASAAGFRNPRHFLNALVSDAGGYFVTAIPSSGQITSVHSVANAKDAFVFAPVAELAMWGDDYRRVRLQQQWERAGVAASHFTVQNSGGALRWSSEWREAWQEAENTPDAQQFDKE